MPSTVRRQVRSSRRRVRTTSGTTRDDRPGPADLAHRYHPPRVEEARDTGYFPPGESVLRRVHEERAVGLLYGQRALLMQATHPVAFTGLLASTTGTAAPFQRLARTARIMETILDRKSTRLNSSHANISYAVFCLKKKK